ncbi:MAG: c-type cytochrome biogenesis protein CcsB [Lachnospiraceae bacterium]|nr:c-type cytochrome biogenesis protein CcsB [Lachnospiraceae bacterium]
MTAEKFALAETILFTAAVMAYLIATVLYFIFFSMKKEWAGKWAGQVMVLGFAVHTLALVVRGVGAGRLPLTNQYEFATSFAWGIALCYLFFMKKYGFRAMGVFVAPVVFLIIGYAAMQSREVNELMPALQSNWLSIHVSTAIISYGSFGVAFGVSMLYLFRGKMAEDEFRRKELPELERLDLISYRAISLGFLFLTLVIVTGAIWAERAWGRYWSWDPKETWSLITWIIYALYLHMRLTKGWRGKKAAWFAVIGFVCVVFTYIGVNTLLPGLHSYA